MKNIFLTLLCCVLASSSDAQIRPNANVEILKKKMELPHQTTLTGEVIAFGISFLGKPYPKKSHTQANYTPSKAHASQDKEVLVVNLQQFDCVTFCESMLALALTHREAQASIKGELETFRRKLTYLRYRKSQIDYAMRFHYFSDWLFQHQQDSLFQDQTQMLGGVPYEKKVHYMTLKRDTLYSNLSDSITFRAIEAVEKAISIRPKWFIPKAKVASIEAQLREGDLIAITTTTEGLDIAHTGFAIRVSGRMHLLHASSQFGQVVISGEPLADYLQRHAGQSGIMVARLL